MKCGVVVDYLSLDILNNVVVLPKKSTNNYETSSLSHSNYAPTLVMLTTTPRISEQSIQRAKNPRKSNYTR